MPRKLESFSPYLLAVIPLSAVEAKTIPCPSFAKAVKMRREFYRLRETLRKENHHYQIVAERITVVHSRETDETHWVRFEPAGEDIEEILKNAGIKLPGVDDIETMVEQKE